MSSGDGGLTGRGRGRRMSRTAAHAAPATAAIHSTVTRTATQAEPSPIECIIAPPSRGGGGSGELPAELFAPSPGPLELDVADRSGRLVHEEARGREQPEPHPAQQLRRGPRR